MSTEFVKVSRYILIAGADVSVAYNNYADPPAPLTATLSIVPAVIEI